MTDQPEALRLADRLTLSDYYEFDAALHCPQAAAELRRQHTEIKSLKEELETERVRLAACGAVALANTPETAAKFREMNPEYRSASCDDVAKAVDREMALRAERDALLAAAEKGTEYVLAHINQNLRAERDAAVKALTEISLCSQNSASSKEECGRIARAAIDAARGEK